MANCAVCNDTFIVTIGSKEVCMSCSYDESQTAQHTE
jgi:hypothetical protein